MELAESCLTIDLSLLKFLDRVPAALRHLSKILVRDLMSTRSAHREGHRARVLAFGHRYDRQAPDVLGGAPHEVSRPTSERIGSLEAADLKRSRFSEYGMHERRIRGQRGASPVLRQ